MLFHGGAKFFKTTIVDAIPIREKCSCHTTGVKTISISEVFFTGCHCAEKITVFLYLTAGSIIILVRRVCACHPIGTEWLIHHKDFSGIQKKHAQSKIRYTAVCGNTPFSGSIRCAEQIFGQTRRTGKGHSLQKQPGCGVMSQNARVMRLAAVDIACIVRLANGWLTAA